MTMRSGRPGERRLRDQIRFLLDTARALSREPDLDALFTRLNHLIAEQFDLHTFFIALEAEEGEHLSVPFYVQDGERFNERTQLPIGSTVTGGVFRSGQPMLVRSPEEFGRLHTVVLGPNDDPVTQSAIYAPISAGDRTLGVLSVQNDASHAYDERDLELLVAVGEQTGIAVVNAWRLIEIEQQRRELQLLVELGRGLTSDEFSLQQMCRRIHKSLKGMMDAYVFYVALLSDDGENLHPEYCADGETELRIDSVPIKRTLAESVITSGEPIVVGDLLSDRRVGKYDRFGNPASASRSVLMLPLQLGERSIGVVSAQSPRIDAYDAAALRILSSIADQLALAINNVQLYRRTEDRVDRDALTDLYNRRYARRRLTDELERGMRRGTRVCVLMLDLDNFKAINDTYGHPIGDLALLTVADALRRSCRASDVICRYGGDEFLVIFPDLIEAETAPMVTRLRDELLHHAVPIPGGTISLEASIGVAISEPGSDPDALVMAADRALYADKARANRKRGS